MKKMGRSIELALAVLALAGLLSGCAATRSTFDVPIAQAPSDTARGFVKITQVRDQRRFEVAPRKPSTPSLQNPDEIGDPAIRSRAIARKRGGYGNAMADILLPEGRTVEQLVREAVTKAVQEQGYAVVSEPSPAVARALPLEVDIQQFWSWATPGFWQMSAEFEGILLLKGEALLVNPQEAVRGYSIVKGMAITDEVWQQVMQQGIADLVEQVKVKVKNPAEN
jgi:hypothetical protein